VDDDAYRDGLNWAHTLALLSEKVPATEMLAFLDAPASESVRKEFERWQDDGARLRAVGSFLESTSRWKEAAHVFDQAMRRTGPAAARARNAFRREAQQEQTAAGAEGAAKK
jgi:hypothetical protein